MKTILSIIFCFTALVSFSQQIDENGRPVGSTPSNAVSSVEYDVYLRKDKEKSSASSVIVEYSLPFGSSSGKLILFHPRKDEELKSINLTGNNGTVSINTKEIGFDAFNAGLYLSDGSFVKSQSIY